MEGEQEDRRHKLQIEKQDRQRKLQMEDEDRQRRVQIEEEDRQRKLQIGERKDRSKNRFVWEIVDAFCQQSLSNEDAIRAALQMLVDCNDTQRMQTARTLSSGDHRMIKQFRMVIERLMTKGLHLPKWETAG